MGNGRSSPLVSLEAAEASFGPLEKARLMRAFRRCIRDDGHMTLSVFSLQIVNEHVTIPPALADQIFNTIDSEDVGELNENQILRYLATIKCSSKHQLLEFLFAIYDIKSMNCLSREILDRYILVIYGRLVYHARETIAALDELFQPSRLQNPPYVGYEEFAQYIEAHADQASFLIEWFVQFNETLAKSPDEQLTRLFEQHELKHIIEVIQGSTELTTHEIYILAQDFNVLHVSGSPNKSVCAARLRHDLVPRFISSEFAARLFETSKYPQSLDFQELCVILSMCCRGSRKNQDKFLFVLYSQASATREQVVTKDRARAMIRGIPSSHLSHDHPCDSIIEGMLVYHPNDRLEKINDEETFVRINSQELLRSFDALEKRNKTDARGLDLASFSQWILENPILSTIVGNMAFAGCVQYGLVPKNKTIERLIVERLWGEAQDHLYHEMKVWCLISTSWWTQWCHYVGFSTDNGTPFGAYPLPPLSSTTTVVQPSSGIRIQSQEEGSRPSSILNWSLLAQSGSRQLKDGLIIGQELHVVPHAVWKVLQRWYHGGPMLARQTIVTPDTRAFQLELDPLILRLAKFNLQSQSISLSGQEVVVSHRTSLSVLIKTACQALLCQRQASNARLWTYVESRPEDKFLLEQDDPNTKWFTIPSILQRQSILLLEIQDSDGSWVLSTTGQTSEGRPKTLAPKTRSSRTSLNGGLVGLKNLGNTCYMNSAIQCLSHTRLLNDYFLSGRYVHDINMSNTDGLQGKLALVYGDLMQSLWRETPTFPSSISPKKLKTVISKYNPDFEGQDQHDVQEIVACLLSGLSEDLNRVEHSTDKPYVEQPDSKGRHDKIVAEEWWKNFLCRECSIIVALFTGQYKSLLMCQCCGYQSARFEPFSFLQLPLPESTDRSIILRVFFASNVKPIRLSIQVKKTDEIQQLKEQVLAYIAANVTYFDNVTRTLEDYVLASVNYHSHEIIQLTYDNQTPVSKIHDSDRLVMYQLDPDSALKQQQQHDDLQCSSSSSGSGSGSEWPYPRGTYVRVVSEPQSKSTSLRGRIVQCHEQPSKTCDVYIFKTKSCLRDIPDTRVVDHDELQKKNVIMISLVHRKVHDRASPSNNDHRYFTNSFQPKLFSMPFLMSFDRRRMTGYRLYRLVFQRLERLLIHASSFTQPQVLSPKTKTTESLLAIARGNDVSRGWAFVLRRVSCISPTVSCTTTTCSQCPWFRGCLGCVLYPDKSHTLENLRPDETLAIDWDLATWTQFYNPEADAWMMEGDDDDCDDDSDPESESDPVRIRKPTTSFCPSKLSLEQCLENFTRREDLPEAYCGGTCQRLRPSYKHMELWRLPPVLIIQLKRFHYSPRYETKLSQLVEFPLRGLDVSEFMTKRRHERPDLYYWTHLGGRLGPRTESNKSSRESTVYDLYAVVNHMGALGAGHYLANVYSQRDKRWKCFNDHQCRDVDERDIVTSSAYLLFYARRDCQRVDITDLFPSATGGQALSDEDIRHMLQDPRDTGQCHVQ